MSIAKKIASKYLVKNKDNHITEDELNKLHDECEDNAIVANFFFKENEIVYYFVDGSRLRQEEAGIRTFDAI